MKLVSRTGRSIRTSSLSSRLKDSDDFYFFIQSAFGQIAVAGAAIIAVPGIASADGAVSQATIQRAKGTYGSRIAQLKSAVEAGDFAAVANERNAFILFNSGVYRKDKTKMAQAVTGTNEIFAAIRAGDKGALKSAYDSYVTANVITDYPATTNDQGQGISSDFDYKRSTNAGAIYVR